MATVDQINTAIAKARAYYSQLLNANTSRLNVGLFGIENNRLRYINRFVSALNWDLAINVNDAVTAKIYELLLRLISGYNGDDLSEDPTVIIPGRTVVLNPLAFAPLVITKHETDLIDFGGGNWYLPFKDMQGNNIVGRVPVSVVDNNSSFTFTLDDSSLPIKIFGFANNTDPQIIIVTAI